MFLNLKMYKQELIDCDLWDVDSTSFKAPKASAKAYRLRPNIVVADKAYTGKPVRKYLRSRGIKTLIPEQKMPDGEKRIHHRFNDQTYKKRNVIVRQINHLKKYRRFATHFEKLTAIFLTLVQLAFVRILLKRHFSDTL
jgi:transposase